VMIYSLLQSVRLLSDAIRSFTDNLVIGIEPRTGRIGDLLHNSLMLVTALSPRIGYDRAAEVAHKAFATGRSLKETAVDLGYVTATEFDILVRPEQMIRPGLRKKNTAL